MRWDRESDTFYCKSQVTFDIIYLTSFSGPQISTYVLYCLMQLRHCGVLLALAVAAKDWSCCQGGSPWSWEAHCPLCWVLNEMVLGASCGWRELVVAELEGLRVLRAWCTFWDNFFWWEVKMFTMKWGHQSKGVAEKKGCVFLSGYCIKHGSFPLVL